MPPSTVRFLGFACPVCPVEFWLVGGRGCGDADWSGVFGDYPTPGKQGFISSNHNFPPLSARLHCLVSITPGELAAGGVSNASPAWPDVTFPTVVVNVANRLVFEIAVRRPVGNYVDPGKLFGLKPFCEASQACGPRGGGVDWVTV